MGVWLVHQCSLYSASKLSEERVRKLKAIGFLADAGGSSSEEGAMGKNSKRDRDMNDTRPTEPSKIPRINQSVNTSDSRDTSSEEVALPRGSPQEGGRESDGRKSEERAQTLESTEVRKKVSGASLAEGAPRKNSTPARESENLRMSSNRKSDETREQCDRKSDSMSSSDHASTSGKSGATDDQEGNTGNTENKPENPKEKRPSPKRRGKSFDQWLQEFKEYLSAHGHPYVAQKYPGGLGGWVFEQRQAYEKYNAGELGPDALTAETVEKLTKAGFSWDASHFSDRWKASAVASASTAAAPVPTTVEDVSGSVAKQLAEDIEAAGSFLELERQGKFWFRDILAARPLYEDCDHIALRNLVYRWRKYPRYKYVQKILIPFNIIESDEGRLDDMRDQRDRKSDGGSASDSSRPSASDSASDDSIKVDDRSVLDVRNARCDLEFEEKLRCDREFRKNLKKLAEFQQVYGHGNVPARIDLDGFETDFSQWAANVRRGYKRFKEGESSCLSAEQVADLSFLFEANPQTGQRQATKRYKAGDVGKNALTAEKVEKLTKAGFASDASGINSFEDVSECVVQQLAEDIEAAGGFLILQQQGKFWFRDILAARPLYQHCDRTALRNLVYRWRKHPHYKDFTNLGRLREDGADRQGSVEAAPASKVGTTGSTESEAKELKDQPVIRQTHGKSFEAWLQEFVAFEQAHGHPYVPTYFKSLYSWVSRQRHAYKKYQAGEIQDGQNALTAEKIKILEKAGFAWDASHLRGRHNKTRCAGR